HGVIVHCRRNDVLLAGLPPSLDDTRLNAVGKPSKFYHLSPTMRSSILLSILTTAYAQSDIPLSHPLQSILKNAQSGPLYTYPTDLTQGIIPKPIHSHNDYWRPIPFYSALSIGAISVEADVWLYNETLYIGHEISALKKERTFDSLYIEPILSVLRAQNPNSSFVGSTKTKNGVYDTSSGQTLYLFVDVKTNGSEAWPYIVKALEPLREARYLTTYNGTGVTSGPVTIIGTRNTPLNYLSADIELAGIVIV
ncbi:Altered inheritance of mitochondria protein 6-like, partial [Pseudocercospora fuligena]